jgi:hypothetical protein
VGRDGCGLSLQFRWMGDFVDLAGWAFEMLVRLGRERVKAVE